MKRTPEQDKKEQEAILKAEQILQDGGETGDLPGFEVDGVWICNPTTTENGFQEINPLEYYGQKYVDWYNSL